MGKESPALSSEARRLGRGEQEMVEITAEKSSGRIGNFRIVT